MQDSPKWLESLGNTANGVFAVDPEHRILTWNAGAERLFGYSAAEAVGRTCHEVVCGRRRSGERFCSPNCEVHNASERGALVQDFDLLATTATQRRIWLTVSCTAVQANGSQLLLHMVRPSRQHQHREAALDDILSTLDAYGLTGADHRPDEGPRISSAPPAPSNILSVLSGRELEVLGLLARGASTEGIARQLNLSILTVRCHIRNMLRKTKLHGRAEMVSTALRSGLSGVSPSHAE